MPEQTPRVRSELLHVAEMVAQEKNINREVILVTLEEAIQKAARTKYGAGQQILVSIDRKTCEVTLYRQREVVEEVEHILTQISLPEAQRIQEGIQLGDTLNETLPPIDFRRITAIGAKQVISQRMREVEQEKQYNEFKDSIGEIVNGVIKRTEFGNVIVDLTNGEGLLPRDKLIPREILKRGDRIRCFIETVHRDSRGHQVILSRIAPQFMVKLFTQEVPEIYEGTVEIRGCSRDPGSRAKMSVYTSDPRLDPVGACIGMRGSRVQSVTQELQGERVDILRWSEDPATYIVNALSPVEVSKVILDQEAQRITAVVSEENLSKAIGRHGQNVRLASDLTGYHIEIMTEEKEAERRQSEDKSRIELFMQALDVDEVLARLLVAEGITSLEDIADSTDESLATHEGLSTELAGELIIRARNTLEQQQAEVEKQLITLGIDMSMEGFCGLTRAMLLALGEIGVKSLEDLAGLSVDEIVNEDQSGPLGALGISVEDAGGLILEARHACGWISLDTGEETDEEDPEETESDSVEASTEEVETEHSDDVTPEQQDPSPTPEGSAESEKET